jgi:hypothetical protein
MPVGGVLFVLSILLPVAGIPTVAALSLGTTLTATISGTLLFSAEILGIVAIAIMGKPGFAYIKTRIFGFLKQYGPPETVSRRRYAVGLIMFSIPILFAWLSIYIADWIPGLMNKLLHYAVIGDLLLLASLFVLGGDFWDKIRALFVYDAKARFS